MSFVGPIIPEGWDKAFMMELIRRLESEFEDIRKVDRYEVLDADMSNSWTNLDAAHTVGYWKDAFQVVHINGIIEAGTLNSVVFTLPEGYRPTKSDDEYFVIPGNAKFGYVQIASTGVVTAFVENPSTIVALDGITFSAAV